jgi:mannosyltransferase
LSSSQEIASSFAPTEIFRPRNEVPRVSYLRRARLGVPPVVMLALALWRISGASFWRDEAATLSAVRRPLGVLFHMLARTDVVHGCYYLMMWVITRIFGTSELAVRLPSALAVTAAAAGVAAIGARLASERAGLAAGLMFAVFPVTSRYGQEARSYAIVMMLAVLATYALIRARYNSTGWRWWIAYCGFTALSGWLNLMSLLIMPAHGMSVRKRRWIIAAAVTCALVTPMMVLAWPQRVGTSRFLTVTPLSAIAELPGRLTGSWSLLIVIVPLAVLAVRFRARSDVVRFALPWLLVPPCVLIAVQILTPVYDPRYILFCVPALALLVGSGLDVAAELLADRLRSRVAVHPAAVLVAGAIAIGASGIPAQLAARTPDGHGDNIRLAAQIVARHARLGDAVLYEPAWWRLISNAYPYGFCRLHEVSLAVTPDHAGNFTGTEIPVTQIRHRLSHTRRVWLVEFQTFHVSAVLKHAGWKRVGLWRPGTLILALYQRRTGHAAHDDSEVRRDLAATRWPIGVTRQIGRPPVTPHAACWSGDPAV